MAGHSKFANIQHRKGRQDKLRSKQFAKLSKEIAVASKLGGPDPDGNPRLRLAIANARGLSAAFTKNGGQMGETGSVGFMFDRVGEIIYPTSAGDEDTVMEAAIEAGADDVTSDAADVEEGKHTIICNFEDMNDVATNLEAALGEPESVNPSWKPQNTVPVDEDKASTLMKLIDALEDDDDVQKVYSNFDIDDEVLAKLSS